LPWLEPPDALHLLRFVQEVLTNVLKHARARQLVFRVSQEPGVESEGGVRILIRDDGQGMPEGGAARGGRGLLNLQERARRLGGRLVVSSLGLGKGVEVSLWLPLARGQPPQQRSEIDPLW